MSHFTLWTAIDNSTHRFSAPSVEIALAHWSELFGRPLSLIDNDVVPDFMVGEWDADTFETCFETSVYN